MLKKLKEFIKVVYSFLSEKINEPFFCFLIKVDLNTDMFLLNLKI